MYFLELVVCIILIVLNFYSVQLQAQSSESNDSSRRKLTFNVKWKNQTIPITLDDNESVGKYYLFLL